MTAGETFRDRLRAHWGRMAYTGVVAALAVGFLLYRLDQKPSATLALMAACCLLIALPIIHVVLVLVEEVRRRDWGFVALAAAVLALIGWTIASRL